MGSPTPEATVVGKQDLVSHRRKGFFRRHVVLTSLAALVAALLAMVMVFVYLLNNSLGNIEKVPLTIPEASRPAMAETESVNILMLGTDSGQSRNPGNSILEDAASGSWPRGKYRSDATMLVHFNADRNKAYVISIPRDSYVLVYDETGNERERTKINAALSLYGPSGAISTVENLAGQRIDHLAMVDWDGFESITDNLGGVTVSVAGRGDVNLNGTQALAYVRERYNLPNGDFDRVKRQQNFLRAIMTKVVDRGTLLNPIKLKKTADSITGNLAVDDDWSNSAIRSFALSLRDLRPSDITYMTIPTNGTASDPIAGSIVVVDTKLSNELWDAMRDDDIDSYLAAHPETLLGAPDQVK